MWPKKNILLQISKSQLERRAKWNLYIVEPAERRVLERLKGDCLCHWIFH